MNHLASRTIRLVGVVAVCLSTLVVTSTVAGAQGIPDWSAYLFGPTHSSFNAGATTITTTNASTLAPLWSWTVPKSTNRGRAILYASPTVYDGTVYIGAEDGWFYAVDEATRVIVWKRFLGLDAKKNCWTMGITSTATVASDPSTGLPAVYVFGPDGNLYAMDAATGNILWKSTVYTPSTTVNDYYSWSSPTVANGSVYVGVSSMCDAPLIPGGVASFSQSTGAPTARWFALPKKTVGASVWSSVAVLSNGSVVATTGNGKTGVTRQALHAESIVRLVGSSLHVADSWQVPQSQRVVDADFGGSPTHFVADLDGVSTPMLGACNKNGNYYAFRQSDLRGGPVWQWQMTVPYQTGANEGQCDSAAIWDGSQLIEGGGSNTTIGGTVYAGSVQSLDPTTGTPVWQTGLPCEVIGSPSEDGTGVVAAQCFGAGFDGVYLLDASNGSVLGQISTAGPAFAQSVFDGGNLLVAGGNTVTAYAVPTP